jgi:L-gulono-1,4-lactone dehydrogenase
VGALGVVTAVTLQAAPAFTLEGHDVGRPLEDVLAEIDDLADGAEHFEFFTFPYSDRALTRTNRRVPGPPRPRRPRLAYLEDEVIKNGFFGLMCRAGRARPDQIPRVNRLVARLGGTESRLTDRSYRVFATPRSVRFTEMEYAIPREHAVEAIRAVRALVENRELAVSFPFEVRFVAGDDAFLSPAGGRDTCYIASHMFEGMEYEPFMRGVEEIMDGFGGRPHWGKRHFQTAETLRPRYPEWDRFDAVRERLDPEGRFANDYVRRVLGPPVAARSAA